MSREVFENAQCAPENPNDNCGNPFINCFPKRYLYPQSRPEIRQAFQPWYRQLLWEQMWNGHLWFYQMLSLTRQELLDNGLILESRIIPQNLNTIRNNQIELELQNVNGNTLGGYEFCTIIPFGTLFCGIQLHAELRRTQNNRVLLQMNTPFSELSDEAILLLSPDIPTPIVGSEPPIFLDRNAQYNLFRLRHIGTQNEQKAHSRSVIQLLEGVFGNRILRRGGRNQ